MEMNHLIRRLWLFLTAICLSFVTLQAQEADGGVRFVEGKTFDAALEQAKKEGKQLFVDCYTSWCGPCRMMATKVFPQKVVGDYFNAHFVCLKIDMEKGEGPELQSRWGVQAYPTFLFFNADGGEVNRIVGAEPDAAKFLDKVQKGLQGGGLPALTARYEAGERDTTFLLDYVEALGGAYDRRKTEEVLDTLLKGREAEMLENPRLYQAFLKNNASPYTDAFRYVLSHKEEFAARYDKGELDMRLSMVWTNYAFATFLRKGADGKMFYDKEGMAAYAEEMRKCGMENWGNIVLVSDLHAAEVLGDWDSYVACCSRSIEKYGINDILLYGWVQTLRKHCKDNAKVKAEAVGWMKERLAELETEKADAAPLAEGAIPAIPIIDFPAFYRKMIAEFER